MATHTLRHTVASGTKASMPTLNTSELYFCTDTMELYIGSGGNKPLLVAASTTQKGIVLLGASGGAARFGQKADVGLTNAQDTADAVKIVKGLLQTDSRATNPVPFDNVAYPSAGLYADFKANSSDGLNDGGTYHRVLTYRPWSDSSGGVAVQMAFTDNGNVWVRFSTSAAAWGAWMKLLKASNVIDSTSSTSTTDAASANAVRLAYELASAAQSNSTEKTFDYLSSIKNNKTDISLGANTVTETVRNRTSNLLIAERTTTFTSSTVNTVVIKYYKSDGATVDFTTTETITFNANNTISSVIV